MDILKVALNMMLPSMVGDAIDDLPYDRELLVADVEPGAPRFGQSTDQRTS